MLPISEIKIRLKPSLDELRLRFLAHGLAIYILSRSSLPFLVIIALACCMVISFGHDIWRWSSRRTESSLDYKKNVWFFCPANSVQKQYTNLQIRFDTGFFMLVVLKSKTEKKNLLIFRDQITVHELRKLFIIHNVFQGDRPLD